MMAPRAKLVFIVKIVILVLVTMLYKFEANAQEKARPEQRPNIIVLLVDDLGIGDIGCFGNTTIKTPNVDQLSRDGVQLEHNLAPESLCTPSRAAFLTGRYAIRSGMASEDGDSFSRVFTKIAVQGGLPPNETTFAKVLQQNGYATGYFGKWHLGVSCNHSFDFCHHPNNHGFDYFYGMPLTNLRSCGEDWGAVFSNFDVDLKMLSATAVSLIVLLYFAWKLDLIAWFLFVTVFAFTVHYALVYPHIKVGRIPEPHYAKFPSVIRTVARKYFGCILMRDKKVVEQPVILKDLTHRLTTDALHFIEENKEQPFLLYMAFVKVHTALFTTDHFANKSRHGRYGDNVEEMDWAVGRILKKIDELNLREDTLVYFTSDHGPHLEEISRDGEVSGGFQGIFKGGKSTSFEGGIRVPTIARWPKKIKPGSRVKIPTSSLDLFPTLLDVTKIEPGEIMENRILDGENIMGLLMGQIDEQNFPSRFIYHYCAKTLQAVTYSDSKRSKAWKLHFVSPNFTPGTDMCHVRDVCDCSGTSTTVHEPPLVYELYSDPRERSPIALQSYEMREVANEVLAAIEIHKASIKDVPNQLKLKTFLPWLQHCCNFPFCSCKEKFPHKLISIP